MAQSPTASAKRTLQTELKKILTEPVEGFLVDVPDGNYFEWDVTIFGPPGTLYASGYFKAKMTFPHDYPYSPPTLKFSSSTKLWHPNVYQSGEVCISILHPPVDDPQSGEPPSERWNPTLTVRTILLSVISLLNEPNTFSPANVDASVMFRKWRDSKGKDDEYEQVIKKCVADSILVAKKDKVKVPTTLSEYCVSSKPKQTETSTSDLGGDFYVDDYADDQDYYDDDDEDNAFEFEDDEEDSGNGES